jgi:hypothetical protein
MEKRIMPPFVYLNRQIKKRATAVGAPWDNSWFDLRTVTAYNSCTGTGLAYFAILALHPILANHFSAKKIDC